ncbi:MAG: SMC-Scp complex subunit ScpB [Candidatus Marsarchaeota archaeon]|jgi:segregation and condensation protein B|nr:SMC-Scp complex subunit ScpB [Candidatus Marsarchaeota archaeon]
MQNQEGLQSKRVIEAVLFVSGRALSLNEISDASGLASVGQIGKLLKELESEYAAADTALKISKIGDKYIMELKSEYSNRVGRISGSPDLTKSALRALAYISKNEPVMQSNMVKIFGPSIYQYLKELVEGDFISATRYGRTKKLNTTQKFREYFTLK